MKFENQDLGVSVEIMDDVRQRHIEAYFAALRDISGSNSLDLSVPERMGNFVRAGKQAGIITSGVEDVDEMVPSQVNWLAQQLDGYLAKFLTISPE